MLVSDTKEPWDILQVCLAIAKAWDLVTPQTISNSFRHCGFVQTTAQPDVEVLEEDELPSAELMTLFQCTQEEAEAFYTVDDNLLTSAPGDIDGIAEACMPSSDSDSEDDETSDAETASDVSVSRKDVNKAIRVLKTFICTYDKPMPTIFKNVCDAEKGFDKIFAASIKQKSITDFFM